MRNALPVVNVLLVEDDTIDAHAFRRAFAQIHDLDCRIQYASSAEEAIDWRDSGFHPDLVVLDERLPGMQGSQLAREIREDPAWMAPDRRRPLVWRCSGTPLEATFDADAVLEKPVNVPSLRQALYAARLLRGTSAIVMMALAGAT